MLSVLLDNPPTYSLETRYLTEPQAPCLKDQLARALWNLPVSVSAALKLWACIAMADFLMQYLGIRTQVFTLG